MMNRMRDQSGFSLTELLVAIAIASVVGLAIMNIFQANSKLYSAEKRTSRTITQARIIIDELTHSTRMLGYNPEEKTGGTFWLGWNNGACPSTTQFSTVPTQFSTTAAICNTIGLFFTRDYDSDGTLDSNHYEKVGYYFDSATNTLKMATIDSASGNIGGWLNKFPNVTAFSVTYVYDDGTTSAASGLPDPASTTYAFKNVWAVILSITARSEKQHELASGLYTSSGGYFTETVTSTIMLRNAYN